MLFTALISLVLLTGVNALNVIGYPTSACGRSSRGSCNNLPERVCCTFPRGGLQVQSVKFSVIYFCTLALFQQSSATQFCDGTNRDVKEGPESNYCLHGGSLSRYYGGGAFWYDLTVCRASQAAGNGVPSLSDVELADAADNASCHSEATPTLFGWSGKGVWALDLTPEALVEYNRLPVTEDYDEHIENLKTFGATWYEDAMKHPGAAEVLAEESA